MLEKIILLQNPHWDGKPYSDLYERELFPLLIKKLKLKEIQVLLGVRRSGKSTLFKLLINHLIKSEDPKSIVYLNLDDPVFADVWQSSQTLYKILETSEKITSVKPAYLFLDEIQNVTDWERFVKSIYDTELVKKIFITGSNSSLLQNHYATLLSGRYVINYVRPYCFREVAANNNIRSQYDILKEKSKVLQLLEQLLFYGGFPQVWKTTEIELRREQLIHYFETILLKDCIAHHRIRETKKFQELAIYMLTNNATLYSYNGLANIIDSNENTIKQFIHILEEGFLIEEINQISYSLKKQIKKQKKNYCIDNGLIYAVSLRFFENKGILFENLIYNELRALNYKDIFYFNETKGCDFLVKNENQLIAIQACFELTKTSYEREINGLLEAMKQYKATNGYIITFDGEETNIENNVTIIPFWKIFFDRTIINHPR